MQEKIISIGIDIGTSTTQLVFSELLIDNVANDYSVPRLTIVDKKIIYKSEIIFTPLLSKDEIDVEKIKDFVGSQYSLAHINIDDVKTGAVIITGDTARKNNADKVLKILSSFAGDFVVATAGPDLESLLSGLGANANELSKSYGKSIVNIDIGGGTSNISYFKNGDLKGVACLDIGGRLIKADSNSGKITYVYKKIKELAKENGIDIEESENIDVSKLKIIARLMTEILAASLNLVNKPNIFNRMLTNNGKTISFEDDHSIEGITFSGGVGECIYHKKKEIFEYGDIGILLAEAINESEEFRKIKRYVPKETLRATVVGAGMYTTEITGSTILYDKEILPLKNIPILKIEDSEMDKIDYYLKQRIHLFNIENKLDTIAVSFSGKGYTSFASIQAIGEKVILGMEDLIKKNLPIIIVLEEDIAKAFGHTLRAKLKGKNIICIDGIRTKMGDYIDIGLPIGGGQALPVVIKTLIFNT